MLTRVLGERVAQVLDRLLGGAVDLLGNDDVERHQEITWASLAGVNPAPAHLYGLAALRPGGHLHRHGLVERRDLYLRAQRGLAERDRHAHREVLALASEDRVLPDVHDHEQVAGRAAVRARRAAARHANSLAVVDAGRDPHLHVAAAALDAPPTALVARGLDDRAAPAARRADLRERERALVDEHFAAPTALRTDIGRSAGLGAGAMAHRAHRIGGEADAGRDTVHGVEEIEVQFGLDVGAALRTGLPGPAGTTPASAPAGAAPEQAAEQITEACALVELERAEPLGSAGRESARATPAEGTDARRHHLADLVVLLALGCITEDVVGGRNGLELLFRVLVPRVRVRVVLLGELAVGARDVLLGRRRRHPEQVVVIGFEPLTLWRHGPLPRDLHHRRAQHPTLQRVAGAQDVSDDGLAVAFLLHDRLVDVGVERLAVRLDARKARLLEDTQQLGVHELDALAHALRVRAAGRVEVLQRELERVEHRQQLLDQAFGSPVDESGLLLDHALAVVLELGLHAPERVEVLVPL